MARKHAENNVYVHTCFLMSYLICLAPAVMSGQSQDPRSGLNVETLCRNMATSLQLHPLFI